MDNDEKRLPSRYAQWTDAETAEQSPSDSRNHYDSGSSRAPYLVHATTYPGPSNYPTSSASGGERRTTAVQAPKPATASQITHSQASSSTIINRRPVERRMTSEGSDIRSRSNAEGSPSNNLLALPPESRGQATSSTSMLLSQASRSLNSLTLGVNDVDIPDHTESPPPYVDPPVLPSSGEIGDVKRGNTLDQLVINGESLDAIYLVRENRLDLLQRMLEQGFVFDDVDPTTKRTAIMEAANHRRIGAARILIRSNCRLHLKDVDGWTALHFASSHGDVDMCRMLLDGGAQLDEYTNDGDTPLLLAARGGHTDALLCLLNSRAAQMSSDTSLLNGFLEASKSGNVSTADVFIAQGINPKKIQDSWRPIIYAAQSGSIPMIDFMFAHKCNVKQRDPEGRSALHFAAAQGNTAMVEKLLAGKLSWNAQTKKNQETALHYATLCKHSSAAMSLILHKNANVTMRDAQGVQALHHCVRNGDQALTTSLLNRGAKQDDQTKYGWTPMLLACAYGHLPLVAEFITRGVNLEEKLSSPSLRAKEMTNDAAKRGYWAEIRWPHAGARPLHLALEFSQDEIANTLIAAGAKIEEGDSEGWRPLHYAAFNARIHMVELLLNRGASPHATTAMGNTPLSLGFRESGLIATYDDKLQICELLQAAMNARKKSRFRKLSDAMTVSSNKSREVRERNQIWHTAQLADALYQTGQPEDVGDGGDDQLTTITSNQYTIDDDNDSGYGDSRTNEPLPRITKTMTD